jgi:hypothetical protein
MSLELFVTCSCGQKIAVTQSQCGDTINCKCGNDLLVPQLTKLRKLSGYAEFEVNIVDKLNKLKSDNALPLERDCVSCGILTNNTIECLVQCETLSVSEKGYLSGLIWNLFRPTAFMAYGRPEPEVHGRDISVSVPVRLCEKCAKQFKKSKKTRIALLNKSEIYKELFDSYPQAVVTVVD